MARQLPPWVRDILILPLSVGVAVSIFGFILPKAFAEERELSYSVEGPIIFLESVTNQAPVVSIEGEKLPRLIGFRVQIWNSGDLPLEDLPILLHFENRAANFRVISAACSSNPPHEFGTIVEQVPNGASRRYSVELMNPGDVIEVAILVTERASLNVFSKSKGMRLRRIQLP